MEKTLTSIQYSPYWKISYGTAGQIIYHLTKMIDNEKLKTPENEYQKIIYPMIIELSEKIVNKYNEIFDFESENEKKIIEEILNGNKGKLRKPIPIEHTNPEIFYQNTEFGIICQYLKNRMIFIINKNYENETKIKLQKKSKEFLKELNQIIKLWHSIIRKARKITDQ